MAVSGRLAASANDNEKFQKSRTAYDKFGGRQQTVRAAGPAFVDMRLFSHL